MPPLDSTLVVLPAYNEEATVGDVVREVHRALPTSGCIVVDDCSTDATAAMAESAGATVLRLPFNLGVGGARRAGFRYALENGYSTVVQIDADGQHDPKAVPLLLDALDAGADLVIGARFAGTGDYQARGPRQWAMRMLASILSRTTHTHLTDATSGYRASGPRAIAVFARHHPAEYLGDTIETLVIAARAGLVVRQVPVAMRPRAGGVPSHNPLRSAAYLGRALIALSLALVRPSSYLRSGAS